MANEWLVPDIGKKKFMDQDVTSIYNGGGMRLYDNNLTPTRATVIGDITQCTFAGYAQVNLANFTAAAMDVNNFAITTPFPAIFTPTGGGGSGNIYGCYMVSSVGAVLIGVKRFVGAPLTVALGFSLVLSIQFDDSSRLAN